MTAHFHALQVAEIVAETAEANSIRFAVPPELRDTFAFKAGQHLTLKADIGDEEVRRNYSLCTAPDDEDWMVTVKRIAGGVFSNWVGDHLKAGDVVDVLPPHGSFTVPFDAAQSRRFVGFAGGSGITPVISLIKTALSQEPGSRFTLLYGNRDQLFGHLPRRHGRPQGPLHEAVRVVPIPAEGAGESSCFNGMLDEKMCVMR